LENKIIIMKNYRTTTLLVTGLMWVAAVIAAYCLGQYSTAVLFFVFMLLNPSVLILNAVLALRMKCDAAQKCLLAAAVVYGIWFVAADILLKMNITTDPFIIMLFKYGGGAVALAAMAPLWITAFIMDAIVGMPAVEKTETP
jgi:hypothetical protein